MKPKRWWESWVVILPAALLAPPLGLILLWMRSGVRVWAKLVGTLVLAILTMGHLVKFYGLRVELDGTGMPRFFTFRAPERHFEAVEKRGAAQPEAPAPTPAPTAP